MPSTRGIVAVILTIGSVATATPATADPASELPLTNAQLRAAGMRVADVPQWFAQPPRMWRNDQGTNTTPIDACLARRGAVLGRQPIRHGTTVIGLDRGGIDTATARASDVRSEIFAYQTRTQARTSWRHLVRDTRRCVARLRVTSDEASVDLVQRRRTLPARQGLPGLRISRQIDASSTEHGETQHVHVSMYQVYRQVGTAIVRVSFARLAGTNATQARIRPRWQRFTEQQAQVVSRRIARPEQ